MARGVVLEWGGEETTFELAKIDREKLYGKKERVAVDREGRPCSSAWLSADGATLVPGGGLAYVYVNDKQDTVERSELESVDAEGQPAEARPSTLGVSQPLVGPISPSRVLEFVVSSVYWLDPVGLSARLGEALDRGEIFETDFVYRSDYGASRAFVLKNDAGIWLLVGQPDGFGFLQREALPVDEPSDDESADDLDFSMM